LIRKKLTLIKGNKIHVKGVWTIFNPFMPMWHMTVTSLLAAVEPCTAEMIKNV